MSTCAGCGHSWEHTWKEKQGWTYCPDCSQKVSNPAHESCGATRYFHTCVRAKGHEGHHRDEHGAWN